MNEIIPEATEKAPTPLLELVRANILHMKRSPGLSADFTAPFSLEGLEEIERVCLESIRLAERLKEAREALQELVDCKDMHDRIENRGNGITADEAREIGREYRTRRPLAWDRARALLRSGEGE